MSSTLQSILQYYLQAVPQICRVFEWHAPFQRF